MKNRWKDFDKIHNYFDNDKNYIISKKYKCLFDLFNINYKENTLLEVGCGHGILSLIFRNFFTKMVCIDKDKKLIDSFNKKIYDDKIKNIITQNISCSKFQSDKKFNIIIFSFSFVWIKNKKKSLNNIINYLENDGYLLVIEPFEYLNDLSKNNIDKNKMIESINVLFYNKKIKLIYLCEIDRGINYLFHKNNE